MSSAGEEAVDAYIARFPPDVQQRVTELRRGAPESRVAPFRSGKDTVRFLHTQDLPYDLVADVCDQLARRAGPD